MMNTLILQRLGSLSPFKQFHTRSFLSTCSAYLCSQDTLKITVPMQNCAIRSSQPNAHELKTFGVEVLQNKRAEYRSIRQYVGPVKAVILDWAGTVVDCGVYSPAVTFLELFKGEGVPITDEEARGPMGTHKRVHIQKILESDSVREKWINVKGCSPTEEDITRMYNKFVPMNLACLEKYSGMIDGSIDIVNYLQKGLGLKIGSTTGFTTPILDILKVKASKEGYNPDCYVAADEVPQARPCPYMVWMNAIKLDVHPVQAIVKVDDTADGVREGTSAGCWSVGLAKTGNYVASTEDQLLKMDPIDYERKINRAYDILADSGAHYVIDCIKDLPAVVDDINRRLAMGDQP